jgi:MFS family permease
MESQGDAEKKSFRQMYPLIPRKVKWLIYLGSFNAFSYSYFFITVAGYFAENEVSSMVIGLIIGGSGAAFIVSAIPFGIYADRHGRKKLFIFGLLGIPPALAVFAFTTDPVILIAAAVVAGIAEGAFNSAWNALIADMTTQEVRMHSFSLSFIVGNAAGAVGFVIPAAFPFLIDLTGATNHQVHAAFFLIAALVALIPPIGLSFVLKDYREVIKPGKGFVKGKNLPVILKFSGCNSLIGLGAGFIVPLIPTWLVLKFQVPDTLSGPLLGVASITMGFSAIVSAALALRYGSVRAIVLTQSLATVFMVSLAYIPGVALAAGLYLVRAALMNMASPISDSYLMSIILPEERGLASSINTIVWRLPNSVTTIVGGYILDSKNYELPFLLAALFYAISIISFYSLFRNVKPIS